MQTAASTIAKPRYSWELLRGVLTQHLRPVAAGVLLGVALGWIATMALRSILFESRRWIQALAAAARLPANKLRFARN
jgi:hypothetical protein